MGDYRKLEIWFKAKELAKKIYQISGTGEFSRDFGLRDQIRRSAISIPSNIAEGEESGTNKMCIKYFYVAKASLAELSTQLQIAHEIGYFNDEIYNVINGQSEVLSKQLKKLIEYRLKHSTKT